MIAQPMSDMKGRLVAPGADIRMALKPLPDVAQVVPGYVAANRTVFQSLWSARPAAAQAN